MTGVVDLLRTLPPEVVLLIAVVLVAGETGVIIGLVFPVEITLMTVGFLAYAGQLPFLFASLLMLAAALAGDALALRSGRKYGPRVRNSRLGRRVGPPRWERADQILHRLGGRSAFVARWVPFVRTLLPRLAGSAGMPYRTFLPWNAAGVLTAVGSSVVLGYLAGASYARVAEALGRASTAVFLLLLVVAAILVVGRWLGRHPHPVQALALRMVAAPPVRWLTRRYAAGFGRLAARTGPGWALVLNLVAGLGLLFAIGFGLSWSVQLTVDHSGLSGVDEGIAQWFAERHSDPVTGVAEVLATGLGGPVMVVVVAVLALLLAGSEREPSGRRSEAEPSGQAARVGLRRLERGGILVGTVGVFLPLVVLAAVADASGGGSAHRTISGEFSTYATVATAGLCVLAWLLTRRSRWPVAVAGWTLATVVIVVMLAARLYLGWDTASRTLTAVLLGVMWPAVFMVAWAARQRAARDDPVPVSADPGVVSQKPQ